jgi:hypothetical protein
MVQTPSLGAAVGIRVGEVVASSLGAVVGMLVDDVVVFSIGEAAVTAGEVMF